MLAPPGLRELIQGLVIVMKMLRVKPEGVSRWVAAGLCWVWVICSTQEAEAAGGSVQGRDVPFGAGPCSGRNFPCSLWS